MILIKPSFEILYKPENLNLLEYAGRLCYKSEDKTGMNTDKFLEQRIKEGHESLIEHLSISVKIICNRSVSHELVRHRLASYSQESQRYCNYAKKGLIFIIPPWVTIKPEEYTHSDFSFISYKYSVKERYWFYHLINCENTYKNLLSDDEPCSKWLPEEARDILPNAIKTEIITTMNMRTWRHVLKLRTSKKAYSQMREIMIPLLEEFRKLYPSLFNDI